MAGTVNNKPALVFSWSGGRLITTDIKDEYTELNPSDYVCVDIVVRNGKICNGEIKESLTSWNDVETTSFLLKEDGLHTYYRLLIPRAKYYVKNGLEPNSVFYYQHKFYYSGTNSGIINLWNCTEIALKNLYLFLENLNNEGDNQWLSVEYNLVSVELLKKAFAEAQDEYIASKTLNKYDSRKRQKRDVLMAAILACREYLDQDNQADAITLIESIESSNCLQINSEDSGSQLCGCKISWTTQPQIVYKNEITDDDLQYKAVWTFGDKFPIIFS